MLAVLQDWLHRSQVENKDKQKARTHGITVNEPQPSPGPSKSAPPEGSEVGCLSSRFLLLPAQTLAAVPSASLTGVHFRSWPTHQVAWTKESAGGGGTSDLWSAKTQACCASSEGAANKIDNIGQSQRWGFVVFMKRIEIARSRCASKAGLIECAIDC